MELEDAAEEASTVGGLLPLASASQQPYVSELLSFTLDRLHKVFFLSLSVITLLSSEIAVRILHFFMWLIRLWL